MSVPAHSGNELGLGRKRWSLFGPVLNILSLGHQPKIGQRQRRPADTSDARAVLFRLELEILDLSAIASVHIKREPIR